MKYIKRLIIIVLLVMVSGCSLFNRKNYELSEMDESLINFPI